MKQATPPDQLLDDYLAASEGEDPVYLIDHDPDLSKWKKLPKPQIIDLIEAILKRLNWLYAHDAELSHAHVARIKLVKLLRVLYSTKKLPCTETYLRMMLDLSVPLLDRIEPDG